MKINGTFLTNVKVYFGEDADLCLDFASKEAATAYFKLLESRTNIQGRCSGKTVELLLSRESKSQVLERQTVAAEKAAHYIAKIAANTAALKAASYQQRDENLRTTDEFWDSLEEPNPSKSFTSGFQTGEIPE